MSGTTHNPQPAQIQRAAAAVRREPVIAVIVEPAPRPTLLRRVASGVYLTVEWLFGALVLVLGLAVLAAVPVVQFLSLGYLLEVSGRVARTGRLRSAAFGVRKAARVGGIVAGVWLCLVPLRLIAQTWQDAVIVDTTGTAARRWQAAFWIVAVVMALHVIRALVKGGRLRHFLIPSVRPIRAARWLARCPYAECRDAVCDFVAGLRLPHYFWLGLRGFVAALVWLAPPITLLALGRQAPLVGLLGGVLLGIVVLYVPFLQARFAVEDRLAAMFDLRQVRATFRAAPLAFAIALAATLASAVPLYLLKIEMIPREAAWLPSLVFVTFMFPARVLSGWAVGRGIRRAAPRHWFWRTLARLGMGPLAGVYVLLVFFTQFTSWYGLWSLYEQHAFLLPVPFLSM